MTIGATLYLHSRSLLIVPSRCPPERRNSVTRPNLGGESNWALFGGGWGGGGGGVRPRMDQANTTWWLAHPRATCGSTRCFLEPLSARSSSAGPKAGAAYALSTPSLSFSNRIYIYVLFFFVILFVALCANANMQRIHPRRPPLSPRTQVWPCGATRTAREHHRPPTSHHPTPL